MWPGARRYWHSGCHNKSPVSALRRRTSGHRCYRSSRELGVTVGWLVLFTCITYAYGRMIGALHLYYLCLRSNDWCSSPVLLMLMVEWLALFTCKSHAVIPIMTLSTAPTVLWTAMESLSQASQSQTKETSQGSPTAVHISCSELCVLSHLAQVWESSEFGGDNK